MRAMSAVVTPSARSRSTAASAVSPLRSTVRPSVRNTTTVPITGARPSNGSSAAPLLAARPRMGPPCSAGDPPPPEDHPPTPGDPCRPSTRARDSRCPRSTTSRPAARMRQATVGGAADRATFRLLPGMVGGGWGWGGLPPAQPETSVTNQTGYMGNTVRRRPSVTQ